MDAITFRQVRYFLAVAESGSFTAAAHRLNVSQPAVGAQVKLLEDQLGLSLFERHARGVRLTGAGAAYRLRAEQAMQALAEGDAALTPFRTRPVPAIRLGVTPSIARSLLPQLLYRSAQPGAPFRLEFVEGVTDDLVARVAAGALDCAFGYEIDLPGLRSVPLIDERLCVVGPPGLLDLGDGPFPFSRLADLPLVLSPRPNRLRDLVDAAAAGAGIALVPVVELNLAGLKRDFLLRYSYCALSPRGAFVEDLRDGRIVGRPLADPAVPRRLYMHFARGPVVSMERELLALIRQELAENVDCAELCWTQVPAEPEA